MSIVSPVFKRGCLAIIAVTVLSSTDPVGAADFGQPYGSSRRSIDQSARYSSALPIYRPQIWEGLYLGGNLGADFISASGASDEVGVIGGVHAGYNWQFGSFVSGFEIDSSLKSAAPARGASGAFSAEGQQDWITSMRLRLGYAPGSTLFYLTGGFAVGNLDVGLSGPGFASRKEEIIGGYTLGAGIEMKFAPSISGRVEALHHNFGEQTVEFTAGTVKTDVEFTTVRAGLTWHFN